MFIKIEDGQIKQPPKCKPNVSNYGDDIEMLISDGYREATLEEVELITSGHAQVVDNMVVDYRTTPQGIAEERDRKICDLYNQISVIDAKRSRAFFEPSIKDEATGQSWLDFYNGQITGLRGMITEIRNNG